MLTVGTTTSETSASKQTTMPTFATDKTTGTTNGLFFLFSMRYQIAAIWKLYGVPIRHIMQLFILNRHCLVTSPVSTESPHTTTTLIQTTTGIYSQSICRFCFIMYLRRK